MFSIGQIIGLVVADNAESAQRAANLVQVEYEVLAPVILTIEDAIKHGSYYEEHELKQGDVEQSFKEAHHVLQEELVIGGQEHFYMEPNACMVVPSNDDREIHIYAGCQSPCSIQESLVQILKRDASRIICHTKRVGGGFGGKESRA